MVRKKLEQLWKLGMRMAGQSSSTLLGLSFGFPECRRCLLNIAGFVNLAEILMVKNVCFWFQFMDDFFFVLC